MRVVFLAMVILLTPVVAIAGDFRIGERFWGWNDNFPNDINGWELWTPFELSVDANRDIKVYAQGEFGWGNYQFPTYGFGTTPFDIQISGLSNILVGGEFHFPSSALPSFLNVGFTLPTGNKTLEIDERVLGIPAQFLDARYQGRDFGVNFLYHLAFSPDDSSFGLEGGYISYGALNPTFDMPVGTDPFLTNNDGYFFAFDHSWKFPGGASQAVRFWLVSFLATQYKGMAIYEYGSNLDLTYDLKDPNGFSCQAGAQLYFNALFPNPITGVLIQEPYNSFGPRFYLNPSLRLGDWEIGGQAKCILPNGYTLGSSPYDTSYNAGGYLLGIGPAYHLNLGGNSELKLNASFTKVIWSNAGFTSSGDFVDILYDLWNFGADYEVKF